MLLLGIISMVVGMASMMHGILSHPTKERLVDGGWYAFVVGIFIIICALIVECSQPPH